MISIITPFHNCPELIPAYERAVMGAEVIVIDNASEPDAAEQIRAMVDRLGGIYIRNESNAGFARANNQGLEAAHGDVIVFLNSDVEARGSWLDQIANIQPGALYGVQQWVRWVAGQPLPYLEGWCLIGKADDFRAIGGWNNDFPALYWEDNEICWRAGRHGLSQRVLRLPLVHLNNYTTNRTPGAVDGADTNRAMFESMVREAIQ